MYSLYGLSMYLYLWLVINNNFPKKLHSMHRRWLLPFVKKKLIRLGEPCTSVQLMLSYSIQVYIHNVGIEKHIKGFLLQLMTAVIHKLYKCNTKTSWRTYSGYTALTFMSSFTIIRLFLQMIQC